MPFFFTWSCFVIFVQITQEVFRVEEWVKKAQNDAKNEVHLCVEAEKSFGIAKQECKELASKLTTEERERRSAEAGLKNAQDQVEDQCKLLYQTEIELVT